VSGVEVSELLGAAGAGVWVSGEPLSELCPGSGWLVSDCSGAGEVSGVDAPV
jgi:hypothetical protein